MRSDQRWNRWCAARMSRRPFMGATGAGLVSLLSGSGSTAQEDATDPPQFLLQWGRHGSGEGEFDACVRITVGRNDEVYTAEFRNQRVQRFTLDGEFLGAFSVQPHAGGLAVDDDGIVYVAHWNSNKVAAYSPSGQVLREWGQQGTEDGHFRLPGSIALGPDGLLYVPDQGNSRVQKFTREGKFVGKWGEHGSDPGQFGGGQGEGGRFAGPQFVAFDREGHVDKKVKRDEARVTTMPKAVRQPAEKARLMNRVNSHIIRHSLGTKHRSSTPCRTREAAKFNARSMWPHPCGCVDRNLLCGIRWESK